MVAVELDAQRRRAGVVGRAAGGGLLAGLGLAASPGGLGAQPAGAPVVITEYELPTPDSAPGASSPARTARSGSTVGRQRARADHPRRPDHGAPHPRPER